LSLCYERYHDGHYDEKRAFGVSADESSKESETAAIREVGPAPESEAARRAALDRETARAQERERRRMERRRLLASGPPSPCVSVCQMDPLTGYCIGCLRTIDEIRDWIISTPEERNKILAQLPGRKERSGL
jgi:predicted Fe-S protein YdhL (DUF1289 family)